jgi:hypothetical protein
LSDNQVPLADGGERATTRRSSQPLWIAAVLDLISLTPFGAYLGLVAAVIGGCVAFGRTYTTRQRVAAWIVVPVGLVLAAFWWWFSNLNFY